MWIGRVRRELEQQQKTRGRGATAADKKRVDTLACLFYLQVDFDLVRAELCRAATYCLQPGRSAQRTYFWKRAYGCAVVLASFWAIFALADLAARRSMSCFSRATVCS